MGLSRRPKKKRAGGFIWGGSAFITTEPINPNPYDFPYSESLILPGSQSCYCAPPSESDGAGRAPNRAPLAEHSKAAP